MALPSAFMGGRDDDGTKRVWAALGLVIFLLALLALFVGPPELWRGFVSTPQAPDPATPSQGRRP